MIDRSVCEKCERYQHSDAHKDKWWCCHDDPDVIYDARILDTGSRFPSWCDRFKYAVMAGLSKKS